MELPGPEGWTEENIDEMLNHIIKNDGRAFDFVVVPKGTLTQLMIYWMKDEYEWMVELRARRGTVGVTDVILFLLLNGIVPSSEDATVRLRSRDVCRIVSKLSRMFPVESARTWICPPRCTKCTKRLCENGE
jgi:hypothetical protein